MALPTPVSTCPCDFAEITLFSFVYIRAGADTPEAKIIRGHPTLNKTCGASADVGVPNNGTFVCATRTSCEGHLAPSHLGHKCINVPVPEALLVYPAPRFVPLYSHGGHFNLSASKLAQTITRLRSCWVCWRPWSTVARLHRLLH